MAIVQKSLAVAFVALVAWTYAGALYAESIEVLWLGHSTFRITSTTGKVIVTDPYIKTNPRAPALVRFTGATVVAPYELANNFIGLGWVDATKTIAMNKGGTVAPLGPAIKVHMVPAVHSSGIHIEPDKQDTKGIREFYGGEPVGYVIEFENGFKVYDTGDTDVFGDMALIGRRFKPDLALICIGGHYTMDPESAAFALREYIRPKQVIPQHYGTYPVINRTPAELRSALGNAPIKVLEMKPGDTLRF